MKLLKDWLSRFASYEYPFLVTSSIFIGLIAGFGAVLFRYMIRWISQLGFGVSEYTDYIIETLPWWQILLVPSVGGLIVGPIIYFYAREAKGHGVPEVMEAILLKNGAIRPRVAVAKSVASAISIGTGASVGSEGPIVQIGAGFGSTIGQIFKAPPRITKTLVACGAAGGIAATFNAPIAGALFSLEIILGDFAFVQFSPIVISSVLATVVSRHFLGNFPAFAAPDYSLVSPYELIPYALLGVIGAVLSVVFIKGLYFAEDVFDNMKFPGYLKPLLGGLIIGLIALQYPHVFGVGYETINAAIHNKMTWTVLVALTFLKLIGTSISIGSGGSGGIFAPSLFIGAMAGGALGHFVHMLFPEMTATPGAYALVAMGALVAGTTHAPITAILIIFELTSGYSIILPLMISCIISVLISSYICKESIYTMKLVRRGINIFKGQELNVLKSLLVKDTYSKNKVVVNEDTPLTDLFDTVVNCNHSCLYMQNDKKELTGMLLVKDLRPILNDKELLANVIIAQDIARTDFSRVTPNDNLDLAMKLFSQQHIEEIPVVDPKNPMKLLGTLWRNNVIDTYNREISKRDVLNGVATTISAADQQDDVQLTDGYSLSEIPTPLSFIGKTIKALNIRARFKVEIILILKTRIMRSGTERFLQAHERVKIIPSPEYIFEEGDILLCAGEKVNVAKLKRVQ